MTPRCGNDNAYMFVYFQHSTLCESWARSQNHDRELELRQLREERKVA